MNGLDPSSAIRLSLIVGLWAAILGAPLAIAMGWLLARTRFPGKPLLSTLCLAPIVLPPTVTGFLLLQALGRHSVFSAMGVQIPFTLLGAVIAAWVMALPLYILVVRGAIEAIDPRYEELSSTLGMRPWATFKRITLPLALPGIAAGAVLAFARALGEFGATAVVAGNMEGQTRTIALAIYTLLETPSGEAQIRYLVWASLGLALATLLIYEGLITWQRRRLEVDDA